MILHRLLRWLPAGILVLGGCVRLGFETSASSQDTPTIVVDAGVSDSTLPWDTRGDVHLDDLPAVPDQTADQPPQQAGLYQLCGGQTDCKAGLVCVIGAHGVCMSPCGSSPSVCKAGESCYAVSGANLCVPQCINNPDCPSTMICVGDGPYPADHCAPLTQAGDVGSKCCCGVLDACLWGHRCLGLAGQQHYCYETCTNGACGGNHVCVKRMGIDFCLPTCDPLAANACSSYEICLPVAAKKAYCYPATGTANACDGSNPCITGMICISGDCRNLCDPSLGQTCPSGNTCTMLSSGWSACL